MGSYWDFPRYVSVGEKKNKAERKLKQLKKKNKNIKPVIINGRTIARTWWGKAWNSNLERYADYTNRIGRGRSYVRCGSVLDLQIEPGKISSLVQGSESRPYSIVIEIKSMEKSLWKNIKKICEGKLDSLQKLLTGKFPKSLEEIFTTLGKGLFPSPKEISFSCSCPDWASMCKHIAASLYGVGARLDEDPNLFFELRKINVNDLVTEAVRGRTETLLNKAGKKSSRIIEDSDLSSVFGIDLDENPDSSEKKTKTQKSVKRKGVVKKKTAVKTTKKVATIIKKKTAVKTAKKVAKITKKKTAGKTKVLKRVKSLTKVSKKKAVKKTTKTVKKPIRKVVRKRTVKILPKRGMQKNPQ